MNKLISLYHMTNREPVASQSVDYEICLTQKEIKEIPHFVMASHVIARFNQRQNLIGNVNLIQDSATRGHGHHPN